MKFLVAGDLHGSYEAAQNLVTACYRNKINVVVQVGDFGLWGDKSGSHFTGYLNKRLHKHNIQLVFVPGNHEDYKEIARLEEFGEYNEDGHVIVRSNIAMVPRGSVWEWGGKTFLGLGGAFSVDNGRRKLGVDWFHEEVISFADVDKTLTAAEGKDVDYFFSHDCSNSTPWKERIKPDADSMENRVKIDEVLRAVRPKYHFHGHMHTWYDWKFEHGSAFDPYSSDEFTQVYGMDMECERNSLGIFDTDKDDFTTVPWRMPRPTLNRAPEVTL